MGVRTRDSRRKGRVLPDGVWRMVCGNVSHLRTLIFWSTKSPTSPSRYSRAGDPGPCLLHRVTATVPYSRTYSPAVGLGLGPDGTAGESSASGIWCASSVDTPHMSSSPRCNKETRSVSYDRFRRCISRTTPVTDSEPRTLVDHPDRVWSSPPEGGRRESRDPVREGPTPREVVDWGSGVLPGDTLLARLLEGSRYSGSRRVFE